MLRVTKVACSFYIMIQFTPFNGVKTAERGDLWTETAQLSFIPCYFCYSQLSFEKEPCMI
jgi:hypothetical protein